MIDVLIRAWKLWQSRIWLSFALSDRRRLTSRINLARRPPELHQRRGIHAHRVRRFAALSDRVLSVWSNRVFPVAPPTQRRQEPRLYARGYRIRPGLWLFHLQTGSLISAKAAAQKRSAQCLGYLRNVRTPILACTIDYFFVCILISALLRFIKLTLRIRISSLNTYAYINSNALGRKIRKVTRLSCRSTFLNLLLLRSAC